MKRALAMIMCLFLTLTLGFGTVAHAMEPVVSLDNGVAYEMGHTPGDSDQVPADSDKGYPHHHGSCHGHQIGEPARHPAPTVTYIAKVTIRPEAGALLRAEPSTPEHRPPIA